MNYQVLYRLSNISAFFFNGMHMDWHCPAVGRRFFDFAAMHAILVWMD
jgi:hypothetical protein